jgi:site-specific recombinase XerD
METTLLTLVELFSATKQTEGKSPKTISWYRVKLVHFAQYLGDGRATTLPDFALDRARTFVASLQNRTCRFEDHPKRQKTEGGLSAYTVHGYVRTLKVFSSWLFEEGFTATNVLAKLHRPKLPETMITILSNDEIDSIFRSISWNSALGARLLVMVLLLLDTGMRASELCTLTVDNTHLDDDLVKVMGKGRKERILPICANTKKALLRYLSTWRPVLAREDCGRLIVSDVGGELTYSGLLQAINVKSRPMFTTHDRVGVYHRRECGGLAKTT